MITIGTEIPSANRLLRMNRHVRKRLQDVFVKEIWAMLGGGRPRRGRKAKRRVTIISYRKRRLDTDNLYGGAKLVVDALKTLGLIWNDSPAWLDLVVRQEIDGKDPRTEIYVLTVGPWEKK